MGGWACVHACRPDCATASACPCACGCGMVKGTHMPCSSVHACAQSNCEAMEKGAQALDGPPVSPAGKHGPCGLADLLQQRRAEPRQARTCPLLPVRAHVDDPPPLDARVQQQAAGVRGLVNVAHTPAGGGEAWRSRACCTLTCCGWRRRPRTCWCCCLCYPMRHHPCMRALPHKSAPGGGMVAAVKQATLLCCVLLRTP